MNLANYYIVNNYLFQQKLQLVQLKKNYHYFEEKQQQVENHLPSFVFDKQLMKVVDDYVVVVDVVEHQ